MTQGTQEACCRCRVSCDALLATGFLGGWRLALVVGGGCFCLIGCAGCAWLSRRDGKVSIILVFHLRRCWAIYQEISQSAFSCMGNGGSGGIGG